VAASRVPPAKQRARRRHLPKMVNAKFRMRAIMVSKSCMPPFLARQIPGPRNRLPQSPNDRESNRSNFLQFAHPDFNRRCYS
jgi:hypothetical protein